MMVSEGNYPQLVQVSELLWFTLKLKIVVARYFHGYPDRTDPILTAFYLISLYPDEWIESASKIRIWSTPWCETNSPNCSPKVDSYNHNQPQSTIHNDHTRPYIYPYAPWCWNIYQNLHERSPSHLGKYTTTMEHMGIWCLYIYTSICLGKL